MRVRMTGLAWRIPFKKYEGGIQGGKEGKKGGVRT